MTVREDITILIAEDDPDDRLMAEEAFRECRMENPLHFVGDGEELMDYLRRRGRYSGASDHPEPGLILLDLNMPRKDGREALHEIKADPALRHIPVVVLSTSSAEEDVLRSYRDGGNSFITKPASFAGMLEVVRNLGRYWLETVDLPPAGDPGLP
ncbi:response regulator [Arenimonas fontis]|uniref:Response regulator n=1 Tax=Arenimonas fontis TaxID=2608255 RepID=A0A5B2ZDU4_9GAMM|nr:response regulator [Arenimonas fontis]KAA2285404.1 response regulator [Arenimonas fontis]